MSIGNVLEYYGADKVEPKKGWQPVRCPFHLDESPSAGVNFTIGGFRCHTKICGVSGDSAKIVMEQEGLPDRASAWQWIEDNLGISNPGVRKQSSPSEGVSDGKRVHPRSRPKVQTRSGRKPYSWA